MARPSPRPAVRSTVFIASSVEILLAEPRQLTSPLLKEPQKNQISHNRLKMPTGRGRSVGYFTSVTEVGGHFSGRRGT